MAARAGTARAGSQKKGELDGDGDEGLVRFEGEAEGGQQGERDPLGQECRFAREVEGSGDKIWKHEEDEDMVSLAEVARRKDARDQEEEKRQTPAVGEKTAPEVYELCADQSAGRGKESDRKLEGDGHGEMDGVRECDDEGGEP